MFPLLFLGFVVGVNIWLYFTQPILAYVLTALIVIGAVRVRFRLISAFVFGLIVGFF